MAGIGIHGGLKSSCPKGRAGSTPALTMETKVNCQQCGADRRFEEHGVCALCWAHDKDKCNCSNCNNARRAETFRVALESLRDSTDTLLALTTDKEVRRLLGKNMETIEDSLNGKVSHESDFRK